MITYIDGPEVKLTLNDSIFVDAEFYHTGEKKTELEPHLLFPISGTNKYIALLDSEGEQIAVIRDIKNLLPESKKALEDCLRELYMMPQIIRFIDMSEKFSIWIWTAETTRGIVKFEIHNHITAIKPLYDGRVLIKDANDNRYEIPDINKLDSKSRRMLLPNL